ncbi:MAG: ribose 5-phosphate isomerase [Campylobacterota bacterium]|nr:ribose 5-phosphate isomerase [Campylobacterota bacterium]
MKYYIATDHAGLEFKAFIATLLKERGYEVVDLGPDSTDRVDYPDYAKKLCNEVLKDSESKGILICGTGIGMSLAANKVKGIRAALCHDAYTASMARAHNDANVLVMGARVLGYGTAESVLDAWLKSEFEGGRHAQRIAKLES